MDGSWFSPLFEVLYEGMFVWAYYLTMLLGFKQIPHPVYTILASPRLPCQIDWNVIHMLLLYFKTLFSKDEWYIWLLPQLNLFWWFDERQEQISIVGILSIRILLSWESFLISSLFQPLLHLICSSINLNQLDAYYSLCLSIILWNTIHF